MIVPCKCFGDDIRKARDSVMRRLDFPVYCTRQVITTSTTRTYIVAVRMPSLKVDAITLNDFNDTLSRYNSVVPEKLHELDTARYQTIPFKIRSRKGHALPSISKDHVEQLVEWKL